MLNHLKQKLFWVLWRRGNAKIIIIFFLLVNSRLLLSWAKIEHYFTWSCYRFSWNYESFSSLNFFFLNFWLGFIPRKSWNVRETPYKWYIGLPIQGEFTWITSHGWMLYICSSVARIRKKNFFYFQMVGRYWLTQR